jgi:hypothetical protein
MPDTFIIRAAIDAGEPGLFALDLFNCGINETSEHYSSADAALVAARAAYKGPDMKGVGCRVWAEREAVGLGREAAI